MNLLKKTVGFVAVLCVIPAAFALTARPSVMGTVASRLPTMTAYVNLGTTTTNTTSSLMDNAECIEAYTSCLEESDKCGPNFEECTTKVLFHAQMPKCLSTLAQCSATGINSLFGTSSTTALATVASTNSAGEVTDYTYPTNGSVLGQMISGAQLRICMIPATVSDVIQHVCNATMYAVLILNCAQRIPSLKSKKFSVNLHLPDVRARGKPNYSVQQIRLVIQHLTAVLA